MPESLLEQFLLRLRAGTTDFEDSIAIVNALYDYNPTAFTNGGLSNAAGQNEGSCRLFAFAQLQGLSDADTLALFGRFYRVDVLQNPEGGDHGNIRNFMRQGWAGIRFAGPVLTPRAH
jgi:hypothetical protein